MQDKMSDHKRYVASTIDDSQYEQEERVGIQEV